MTALLVGLVLGVGALGAPASAAPNKIGPVADLTLSAGPAAGGGYDVTSSWTPLAGATAYKVVLTSGGTTIAQVTQTAPPWLGTVNLAPNAQITVSVTPLEGKKPGNAASAVYVLPDLAPPTGTFTRSVSGMDATITQTALSDDGTPAAEIARSVNWGDGSGDQPWTSGDTVTHNYAALGRYVPTVKLTDNAGNSIVLTLKAVVLGDTAAPEGHVTAGPASAFAGWTDVSLALVSLVDDYTPAELVESTVAWGDGSVQAWTPGTALTHRYAAAGTYAPSVAFVDEAGNTSMTTAEAVTVVVDEDGPAVRIAKPKQAAKARSWRRVRGTVVDAGVGVSAVALRAVEKRGTTWYAYTGSKAWTKAGTKAKAWRKATDVTAILDGARWTARLKGVKVGKLVVRATGTDHVGNTSRRVSRAAKLIR